jgi:hypothetical protein
MKTALRHQSIAVCDAKIAQTGDAVGLSFYAFFAAKNTISPLLLTAAKWWIATHRLDHFEPATEIRALLASGA